MQHTPPTAPKPTALIVDDDKDLSEAFAIALELVGFETKIINDSTKALERISAHKPDLVTLDMQMPNLSGTEVLRLIRADEHIRRVRVILITANERASATEEMERMADVILIKPVTFSQIKDIAMRLVHLPSDEDDAPDAPPFDKSSIDRKPPLEFM
jgi:CheY-like chemotaxis protein